MAGITIHITRGRLALERDLIAVRPDKIPKKEVLDAGFRVRIDDFIWVPIKAHVPLAGGPPTYEVPTDPYRYYDRGHAVKSGVLLLSKFLESYGYVVWVAAMPEGE